jgi:hypothetical protein
LVDFLTWKDSTHVIAQINAKRMDQKGLETTNRLKNERRKEKNAKNTSRTQSVILPPNPRGHKEASEPPLPLEILVLTQITRISGPLSHKPNKDERKYKMEEVGEMGGSLIPFNRAIIQSQFCPGYN